MKMIITGMPYFAENIHKQLIETSSRHKYIYLDTFYKKIDKIKFIFHVFNSDLLYMIGGSVGGSGAINLALQLNKKVVLHWAGTDVLRAAEIVRNNMQNRQYIKRVTHLCETKWIQKELADIGILAEIAPMMICSSISYKGVDIPKKLKVLSYIGKERPRFYGIDTIIRLANDFGEIEFKVAGLEQYENTPSNITFLGWTDMDKAYRDCLVYIRCPKHDGLAFSVLEALSYGRIVLYNYHFDFVKYFDDYDDLKKQFSNVVDNFDNGNIDIDYKAIEFVNKKFNKDKVLTSLIEIFEHAK